MIDQKYQEELCNENMSDMALMVKKVTADIAFLEDKLKYLNSQRTPNQTVIKIYNEMLNSRENVLTWLSTNKTELENTSEGISSSPNPIAINQ